MKDYILEQIQYNRLHVEIEKNMTDYIFEQIKQDRLQQITYQNR